MSNKVIDQREPLASADTKKSFMDALLRRRKVEPPKFEANRTDKRRRTRNFVHAAARGAQCGRVTWPKTGRPPWWDAMKQETLARRYLSKLPVVALDAIAPRLADSLVQSGVASIYGLARAANEDLRRVPGMGLKTMEKIRAELVRRGVPVEWEV